MARKLNAKTARARAGRKTPVNEKAPPSSTQPGSNVTDDIIRKYCQKASAEKRNVEDAQEKVSSANGRYRAVLKDAKAHGVNPAAIVRYLANIRREVQDVDNEYRDDVRIAKVMGAPFAFAQLDLFGEKAAPTVATAVDSQQMLDQAFASGKKLGLAGKPFKTSFPKDSAAYISFTRGHDEGQLENKQDLGKGHKPGDATVQ